MEDKGIPSRENTAKWLLVFCPFIIYFITIVIYGLNYPFEDDFNAILQFLNNYEKAKGFDKLRLLFVQHNEHRILSSRIIYILYNYLPGQLNFKTILYLGNAQQAGSFFIFLYFVRRLFRENWFWPAFISSLCFFDLANWENAYSPMGSVANYSVVLLFMLSLYFYSQKGAANSVAAVLFQAIATYSLGNGIFACFFIFTYNVLSFNKVKAIISGMAGAVFIPLNFLGYSLVGSAHLNIQMSKATKFFLRMLAGHTNLYYWESSLPLVVGSLIMLLVFLLLPYSKLPRIKREFAFFVTTLGFCLASSALTAYFRSAVRGLPSSRYMLYTHITWAILFVLLMARPATMAKFRKVAYVLTAIFVTNYLINMQAGILNFEERRNWILGGDIRYSYPDSARAIWNKSCELNIYCIPPNHGK